MGGFESSDNSSQKIKSLISQLLTLSGPSWLVSFGHQGLPVWWCSRNLSGKSTDTHESRGEIPPLEGTQHSSRKPSSLGQVGTLILYSKPQGGAGKQARFFRSLHGSGQVVSAVSPGHSVPCRREVMQYKQAVL